jgi:hypothetical protein
MLIAGLGVAFLAACSDDDDSASTTTGRVAETTAASPIDVTTATSGDGPIAAGTMVPATRADYLAAIERSLSSGDDLKTTPVQAECIAPRWLDVIGLDRLVEHDIAPADIGDDVSDDGSALSALGLSPTEGTALYDAFGACDVDIRQLFIELAAEGQSSDVVSCLDDALTPDLLQRLMVSSLLEEQPDDQLQSDFTAAIGPCDDLSNQATATTSS